MFERKEPPVSLRNGSTPHFGKFLAFLRANPGAWCVYHTYATVQSGHQRAMRANQKYNAEGFEFTSRQEADGVSVYGIFNG